MKFLFQELMSVVTVGRTIIAREWQKKMVGFLFKSLECSVTPSYWPFTVNARISARGAYLIFWVERGRLFEGSAYFYFSFILYVLFRAEGSNTIPYPTVHPRHIGETTPLPRGLSVCLSQFWGLIPSRWQYCQSRKLLNLFCSILSLFSFSPRFQYVTDED